MSEFTQLPKPVPVVEVDWSDVPPAGTACEVCRRMGHFCAARGYLEDSPICRECAEGTRCAQELAVDRFHAGLGWDEMEVSSEPGVCRSVPLALATPAVEERPSDWTIKSELSVENLRGSRRAKVLTTRERLCRCGKPMWQKSKSEVCAACIKAARVDKGEVKPRGRRVMADVICDGGCGRKVPASWAIKGRRFASGCSPDKGCKVIKGTNAAAVPKLSGIDATIAYLRKQLVASEEIVRVNADKIEKLSADVTREYGHQRALRATLNHLAPEPEVVEDEEPAKMAIA